VSPTEAVTVEPVSVAGKAFLTSPGRDVGLSSIVLCRIAARSARRSAPRPAEGNRSGSRAGEPAAGSHRACRRPQPRPPDPQSRTL